MMRVSLGQCLATDRRTMIHAITVELVCVATWLHGGWSMCTDDSMILDAGGGYPKVWFLFFTHQK